MCNFWLKYSKMLQLKCNSFADLTCGTVQLMVWVSFVCLSICNECIVAKLCKIRPRLLLITNRKWHIGFQMT